MAVVQAWFPPSSPEDQLPKSHMHRWRPFVLGLGLYLYPWPLPAQITLDTALSRPVLPSDWPPEYWAMVGRWRLLLTDDSTGGRDTVEIQVVPDSIPYLLDRIVMGNHVCRSCLRAVVPPIAWDSLGLEPPARTYLQLAPAPGGIFHAFLGTGWVVTSPCGLMLDGGHSITHASGAWTQVRCHSESPQRAGRFELTKVSD